MCSLVGTYGREHPPRSASVYGDLLAVMILYVALAVIIQSRTDPNPAVFRGWDNQRITLQRCWSVIMQLASMSAHLFTLQRNTTFTTQKSHLAIGPHYFTFSSRYGCGCSLLHARR